MMEQKTSLDLRDSTSPPSIKFDSSPQQICNNNQSPTNSNIKNGVLAFATLSVLTPITEPPKMQIKQLYVQPHQTEYPQLQTDKESDVYAYLENLGSICYPNGVKIQQLQIKTIPLTIQSQKTSSQSPVKKGQLGQIDAEALEILKQYTIAHFTITTSLGVKRYISYLTCNEPQLLSTGPIINQHHASLNQPQQHFLEYNIMPFTFVIVQDSPALDFAKKILSGMYETSLLPYYQMVCLIEQQYIKQQQSMGLLVQPLKIEFILCYMFRIINKSMDDVNVKNFSEFTDSGSVLTYEDHIPIYNYENFYRPNISYKVLLKKISISNILQLLNCLLLEKKLIIISKNTDTNAMIIEALLDLIYPLNSTVFMNISNLKQEIIDYLDSPVPYIIGINEAIWNKVFMKKWNEVSDDTVCFFIETELFTTKVDIPNPPEPMNTILTQTLQDLLSRSTSISERELKMYIRQATFNYLLLTINDFRHYKVNFKELEGDRQELFGMQKDNNIIGLRQIFKFEQYLESQQMENYEFYVQFTGTQIFNDFLERALRTNADQQLNYFISCLDILKNSQSFSELLNYQQALLAQILQEVSTKQVTYIFQDILESYERALNQYDKSIYIKSLPLPQHIDNGLFQFNPNHIEVNLHYEIQKQGCIKNLIKKPSTTRRAKPSKKSDQNLSKHQSNFITNQVESRNQSNSIKENQQIISQMYFQKGPQKVSTPKGLPSEMKSMGNFLSEDDSKSTNSKDHKLSQEENKSENSSFKSFFRFTFEKIQNKLKNNKAELSQPTSQAGTPQKQLQLLFDIRKINVQSLSGLQQFSQEKKREGPLINQPYYMKNSMQQKSIFSSAFGPKSGLSFGRPKCYSETTTSKIQGALQTQIPSNVHYYVDSQNLEARPSAISISNKSYHDSPNSTSYIHESFATAAKGRNEVQANNNNNINVRNEVMFKTQAQKDTPNSQNKTHTSSGSKQVQQQLAYPILNSGIVILKDINRNTKKFVQKININLDPEDERNRRFNQRIQSSMHTTNNQITQSLSNSSLPGANSSMQTTRTLNSSRSGGTQGGIMNSINKTQLSSGLDSPTDHSMHQSLKSSDKKIKNPSFKQASNGPAKQNSGGRQKAISYNQPNQNQDQNLRKPQVTTNIQITPQQSFKQYQTKPKAQLKVKRDSDLTSKQQTNHNISQLVSMKKNSSEKNTPLIYGRQEGRSSLNTNNHSSALINQEYMIQGNSQSATLNQQVKRSMNSIQKDKIEQQHSNQDETFDGVQQRMRSISYQVNQPEFQSNIKYKMKKDKSLKNLANNNQANSQSPNFIQKDQVKLKASKTGNQTTKVNEQTNVLQQTKSQFQTFNEFTTTFDQNNLSRQQLNLIDEFIPSPAILDTDMLDTPKMKFEGTKMSVNLESTISLSLEQSPSPNTNVVGQINQTIVRQDEQFGIYERNMKYNNEFQ